MIKKTSPEKLLGHPSRNAFWFYYFPSDVKLVVSCTITDGKTSEIKCDLILKAIELRKRRVLVSSCRLSVETASRLCQF